MRVWTAIPGVLVVWGGCAASDPGGAAGGPGPPGGDDGLEDTGIVACDRDRAAQGPLWTWVGGADWQDQDPLGDGAVERGAGMAVVDLTGDGRLDVFLPNGSACQLLAGQPDLGFVDVSLTHLPHPESPCRAWGVAAGDIDGDDDLDLVLPGWDAPTQVWTNQGDGSFKDVSDRSGLDRDPVSGRTASLADIDSDGDLDLFIAVHAHRGDPEARQNQLYLNQGDGSFTDVSAAVLRRPIRDGVSFIGGWVDVDGDGDLDMYLINDFGHVVQPNRLVINESRPDQVVLVDQSSGSGLDLEIFGMGLAVADLNGDGVPDFGVSDIDDLHLMMSDPGGGWYDAARSLGFGPDGDRDQISSWGLEFADLDNDGLEDVLVPYGPVELLDGDAHVVSAQPDDLMLQQPDGRFVSAGAAWGLDQPINGRGTIAVDVDGDGWLDVFKRDYMGGPATLQRSRPGCNGGIQIALTGPPGRRQAIGARVELWAGGARRVRWNLPTNTGLASTMPAVVHFGMGRRAQADRVVVTWPGGATTEVTDVAVGSRLELSAP